MRKAIASLFLVLLFSAVSDPGYSQEDPTGTIHLSPADQLILEEIRKVNERIDKVNITVITEIGKLNERIDGINGRIDKLWMTIGKYKIVITKTSGTGFQPVKGRKPFIKFLRLAVNTPFSLKLFGI